VIGLKLTVTVAGVFLFGTVIYTGCLWLAGRLIRASKVTFRRALLLSIVLSAAGLVLSGARHVLAAFAPVLADPFLFLALNLAVPIVGINRVFGASVMRSVAIWLLSVVVYLPFVVGLVFGMKAYLIDASVVTGASMAETLVAKHKTVVCPQCGQRFLLSASVEEDQGSLPPMRVTGCTCPRCRFHLDEKGPVPLPETEEADRFLTVKGLLFDRASDLSRFDVVVVQRPNPSQPGTAPVAYVKRLIGLPGETIAVQAGKLYRFRGPPGEADAADGKFEPEKWEILRKPPSRVLALRHLVYDNDYPAGSPAANKWPRWTTEEETGWSDEGEGTFHHAAGRGNGDAPLAWIRYRHLLPASDADAALKPQLISDFAAYNAYEISGFAAARSRLNYVADLLLECEIESTPDAEAFVLELAKGPDRFRATFDLAAGECELSRRSGEKEESLGRAQAAVKAPGRYRLRFANVDDRLLVWVDDALPFGDGVAYAPPSDSGPNADNDFQPAAVAAAGGVTVRHLSLWRDTYYTTALHGRPGDPDASESVDIADPETWGPLSRLPVRTFTVEPGQYFVLGDNSTESADSRMWGTVAAPLLLGRAVLVYHPLRRAGWLR
jgi:signal peptidase I